MASKTAERITDEEIDHWGMASPFHNKKKCKVCRKVEQAGGKEIEWKQGRKVIRRDGTVVEVYQ